MDYRQVNMMKVVLLVSSLASLLLLVSAAYEENLTGDWREAQATYKEKLLATADGEGALRAASAFAIEQKQLYLAELGTIDRCTSCHLGVENPAMVNAAPPLAYHSGGLMQNHSPDKFGCTICHEGRGRAMTKTSAHGWYDDGKPVPHIDTPMLRGDAVYTSCGRCHGEIDLFGGGEDLFAGANGGASSSGKQTPPIRLASLTASLPSATRLAHGKSLTVGLGCLGCHQYRGRGGSLGPDLTYVGDKIRHDYDFGHVKGEHTIEQWLFEHFKFPQEVSPDTLMPDMSLSDDEARDLSLYMMSLHRKSAPASHMPSPSVELVSGEIVRGDNLFAMFCSACHGSEGFGTTMREGLWPKDADPWGHDWDARSVVVEQRSNLDVLVPSLNHADTLATVSDQYLYNIISKGRPNTKMLAWSNEGGLTDDEVTLLVDYIRDWDEPLPDLASVSATTGDARVGGALYRANCSACHGYLGEGGIGNTLNSPTFLAVASDDFLRDTIVFGRPNTAMPAWRGFDGRELSDILAYIRQWQVHRADEAEVLSLVEMEDSTQVSVDIGQTLYKANCVMCHGWDGAGDLAPTLNTQAFLTVARDEYLVDTMVNGRAGTGMPSWRHLSSADVASLIKYMRTWQLRESKPDTFYSEVVPHGDWDAGKQLFVGHCSGCHGTDAEGATGPQLNNPTFLRNASDVMLREWITFGKEGTEMRGFRKGGQGISELSDRQIEDVVSYLRLLERTGRDELNRVAKSPHGRPENGVLLYAANCAGCHGVHGEGASGPALSNPNFLKYASDGFLMATMALGRTGTEMRPVKRGPQSIAELTGDEINDLVAYLRLWEHERPHFVNATPHRFVVPWDLSRGQELFTSNCEGCHGEEGKGSWAPELNNEGFLAAATDGFLQATIVRGRKGTAMRPFGRGAQGLSDLSSDDIDDIVAYIRHWSKDTPSPMTLPAAHSIDVDITKLNHESISSPITSAVDFEHTQTNQKFKNPQESQAKRTIAAVVSQVQGE